MRVMLMIAALCSCVNLIDDELARQPMSHVTPRKLRIGLLYCICTDAQTKTPFCWLDFLIHSFFSFFELDTYGSF